MKQNPAVEKEIKKALRYTRRTGKFSPLEIAYAKLGNGVPEKMNKVQRRALDKMMIAGVQISEG